MSDNYTEVVYYPNFSTKDLTGIKQSLYLYDKVNLIGPNSTQYPGTIFSNGGIDPSKNLEVHYDLALQLFSQKNKYIEYIYDSDEVISKALDSTIQTLVDDLKDKEILEWDTNRVEKNQFWLVDKNYFANIDIEKINEQIEDENYKIDTSNDRAKVPFLVGMSLGLSEAMLVAIDRNCNLFTNDIDAEKFLRLRLKRGHNHLISNSKFQDNPFWNDVFNNTTTTGLLGIKVLQLTMPNFIYECANKSFEHIFKEREESDRIKALDNYRSGISSLVRNKELWKISSADTFRKEVFNIFNQELKPALEELEKNNIQSHKEYISIINPGKIMGELFKSLPKLFISSAKTAIEQKDIFALCCNLISDPVENYFNQLMLKKAEFQSIEYLTYPLLLKK